MNLIQVRPTIHTATGTTATVSLYRPTELEIDNVLASASRAWPILRERIAKAGDILRDGLTVDAIDWHNRHCVRWLIPSQTKRGLTHSVIGSQRLTCNCGDRTPVIADGRRLCKHTLAVAAYQRILRDRLNADIRAFDVRLSALSTGECEAYAQRLGSVFVKKDDRGIYHFVDDASAVRYSLWLARRQTAQALTAAKVGA
jgi:hypothetical protein